MSDDDKVQEVAIETAVGKLAAKGIRISDLIGLGTVISLSLMIYMLHEHKAEARDGNQVVAGAIKELAKAQQSAAMAQREMTCIIALPQDKREQEFMSPMGMCKRVSSQ